MSIQEDRPDRKEDREAEIAKRRCADFVLQMSGKYGREILREEAGEKLTRNS